MNKTPEETKKLAIKLYRKGKKIKEISNLTGLHITTLTSIFREGFENGELEPRRKYLALHNRTPNGQGRKRVPSGVGKGGRNKERKKFTPEQEAQFAVKYYEEGCTFAYLQEKYGLHPVQMQKIRNKYQVIYGVKKQANKKYKTEFEAKNGSK